MKTLKVALIQMNIVWEDKESNLNDLSQKLSKTIVQNPVDLIVLPEMFATGFTMKPDLFWEDESGITFQWLMAQAKVYNCAVSGGIITKTKHGNFRNTFLVCTPDGNVQQYHKRHLFRMGEENHHYVAGTEPLIISLNNWLINLQVCYDLRFPAFARNKMVDGKPVYDLLIYIANWPEVRTYAWTNLLRSRAIENQAFTIGVNRVGEDGNGISHSGESAAIDPYGNYLINPMVNEQEVRVIDLDYSILESARKKFPVLLDADQITITDNPA